MKIRKYAATAALLPLLAMMGDVAKSLVMVSGVPIT